MKEIVIELRASDKVVGQILRISKVWNLYCNITGMARGVDRFRTGTHQATEKKFARQIAFELGICIVSGMARGVDSEAHWGALEAGGSTMAFLGSGIDVVYPPENLELYKKIQVSGAILSEFPIGRRVDRKTFPMRNRLVAGASLGVRKTLSCR